MEEEKEKKKNGKHNEDMSYSSEENERRSWQTELQFEKRDGDGQRSTYCKKDSY
jgi:hypothetical protein